MNKHISISLCILFTVSSCENRYRKGQMTEQSSPVVEKKLSGTISAGAYQVTRHEYDQNFETRYGLLYLSTSNIPLSGRILTIDSGENGDFVFSDEHWKDGKKHGKSSKWFTNGVKMYERHYHEGKWHGTVTRWWPNGQKMYVRAYSNGVRHGEEATWRSDGTALSLPGLDTTDIPPAVSKKSGNEPLSNFDISEFPASDREINSEDSGQDFIPAPITENSSFEQLSLPNSETEGIDSNDDFGDLPTFPSVEEEGVDENEWSNSVSELQGDETDSKILPEFDSGDTSVDLDQLPPLLDNDSVNQAPLPDLAEGEESLIVDDLPLPDLPLGGTESDDLPPLPSLDDDGSLPPLPAGDDGSSDLPPLPPLP